MDVSRDTGEAAEFAVKVLSSSLLEAESVSVIWETLLRRAIISAAQNVPARALFELTPNSQVYNPSPLLLWATQVPEVSSLSIEDARQRCATFLGSRRKPGSSCILLVRPDDRGYDDDKSSPRSVLVVLSMTQDAICNGASLPDQDGRDFGNVPSGANTSFVSTLASWAPWRIRWLRRHQYEGITSTETVMLESRRPQWSHQLIRYGFLPFVAIMLLVPALLIVRGHQDTVYDRYDTSGSEGPRHQLRIYWQNASEWAAANPQDSGKWKVRIDDQAIIPAELYDEDEDRYQQWYRTRYPEMQEVIDNYDYVRPSWMGSLNMKVPWDDQFHFAHCVLALRRYWKAKETGKHVCGRDIDYLHIDHCLGSLEKRVFIDGPRDIYDPPIYMYWQTKVCF